VKRHTTVPQEGHPTEAERRECVSYREERKTREGAEKGIKVLSCLRAFAVTKTQHQECGMQNKAKVRACLRQSRKTHDVAGRG
jgi:hypothetical protein